MLASWSWSRRLPPLVAVAFGLAISYVNLHSDQVSFVVLPLFAAAFWLAFASPRGAWRWTLLLGLWVPLMQWWALLSGQRLPYPNDWTSLQGTAIAVLFCCLLGMAAGLVARKVVFRPAG
ncbi:MAG: hypothetical protein M1401_02915 [Chloroflexi bacterium]|nr:hypothetical protein [Chloroflexota bacterium]